MGGTSAASLTSISIRYCAYAPRATALRACDVCARARPPAPEPPELVLRRGVRGEGTLLLWGVCNEITRLLESRGGRVAVHPSHLFVLRKETDGPYARREERFDEGEIDEAAFKETKAGLLMVGRHGPQQIPRWGWHEGVVESADTHGLCKIDTVGRRCPAVMTRSRRCREPERPP